MHATRSEHLQHVHPGVGGPARGRIVSRFCWNGYRIFLWLLLVQGGLAASLYAQDGTDSLEARLPGLTGAARIEVLTALTRAYERSDPARAVAYGREALSLLRRFPDPERELDVLYQKGRAHIWLSAYDSARVHAKRADALARATGNRRGQAEAANLMGTLHSMQGAFHPALDFFQEALASWEAVDDREGVGNALNNLGIASMRLGRYDEALTYYLRALEIWEAIGDPTGIARVLNNLGNVHTDLGNLDEALDFYRRTLAIREDLGDRRGMAVVLNNIGLTQASLGDTEEALRYYAEALAIWESVGDKNNLGRVLNNISEVYADQERYPEALDYARRALDLREAIGDRRGMAIALHTIGMLHQAQGRTAAALGVVTRAARLADEVGDQRLIRDTHRVLSELYATRGAYRSALEAHRRYKAAHDSLFNAESQSVVAQLQTWYRTREQRQEIDLLQRNREIQRLWRNILLGGLFVTLLVAFLLNSRYRLKHRAHRALEQAHAELKATQAQLIQAEKMASLGALTAGIAHEIKNPLNFVNNFSEIVVELAAELTDELDRDADTTLRDVADDFRNILADLGTSAEQIVKHGRRADAIVGSMMEHAVGGTGRREATDVNALVSEYAALAYHGKQARTPGFEARIETHLEDAAGTVNLVPKEIGRVLVNLLDNAFDAGEERRETGKEGYEPTVTISTRRVGEAVEIRIADNGPGIPADLRQKIFEPFFTTKPTGSGTGLGLSIAYDVVTQGHGGTLAVESSVGRGTTFLLALPVRRSEVHRRPVRELEPVL